MSEIKAYLQTVAKYKPKQSTAVWLAAGSFLLGTSQNDSSMKVR